jgi:hypothetical protein
MLILEASTRQARVSLVHLLEVAKRPRSAILFLRMNRVLWDERTVMEALAAVRADQKDEHLQMKLDLENNCDNGEEHGVGIADANEDEE